MPRLLSDTVTRIDATTLARVKALLDLTDTVTARDNIIESIIDAVSSQIEDYISCPLASGSRTEEYDLRPRQGVIFLRVVPVTLITTIKVATDWDFNVVEAVAATDYHLNPTTGEVWLASSLSDPRTDGIWPNFSLGLQVVYTAGLAADTATLISSYPTLALAADLWCAEVWRRRTEVSGTSKRIGDSSHVRTAELQMPKAVAQMLAGYQRIRFGMA